MSFVYVEDLLKKAGGNGVPDANASWRGRRGRVAVRFPDSKRKQPAYAKWLRRGKRKTLNEKQG